VTSELWAESHDLDGATVVTPHGVLDAATYRSLRDVLVKVGVEEPRAVIVDLTDLVVPDPPVLALFVTVSDQLAQWPGVTVLLVAPGAAHRELLEGSPVVHFVPVFGSVSAALAAVGDQAARRIARRDLPNGLVSARLAREFVADTCVEWGEQDRVDDAVIVVDALVENTLVHTYCAPSVRLELRKGRLTVAVYDDDPATGGLLDPAPTSSAVHGMAVVDEVTTAWGCEPRWSGGKVVWAVL
jgi:anti-anti-sigma regulatory factor